MPVMLAGIDHASVSVPALDAGSIGGNTLTWPIDGAVSRAATAKHILAPLVGAGNEETLVVDE